MGSSAETPASCAKLFRDRIAGVALVAFALGIAWEARGLPFGSLGAPGPGMLPLALAVLLAGLGLLLALKGGGPALGQLGWSEARHVLAIFAALAFAALALESLGYRLTVAAVLLFLIGAVERKGWGAAFLVAVGFAGVSHALFADFLRVPLPRGIFGI